MPHTYRYPRPAVTVDAIVLAPPSQPTHLLLIARKKPPFPGCWALPGGFVDEDEDPADAVAREVSEETGLTGLDWQAGGFYGQPGRDPRGHTISLVFRTATEREHHQIVAADDAAQARWHPLDQLPPLAFDHADILRKELASPP
ncbi:NUDIX domain-containing protein [Roseibacillus ishigakijimensis]|nr:NUDIX hydrolase [Roseibacillus ishigakijimensis]